MPKNIYKIVLWLGCLCCLLPSATVAKEGDKPARQSLLYIRYYQLNNTIPYLGIQAKNKLDKRFVPVGAIRVSIFLNGDADSGRIGTVTTNAKGEAKFFLPASASSRWLPGEGNEFLVRTEASAAFDAAEQSVTVVPSKLEIDTGADKTVTARLMKKEGGAWVPMPETDIRLAVKRMGGNLNIGEDETYTSDSTGHVEGVFQRAALPGDSKGNIEIVAMVDDHDEVGTLISGMVVPWGIATNPANMFDERSLWATGRKAPVWLLVMAFACIVGVWSVVIILISRIIKIRKLGIKP